MANKNRSIYNVDEDVLKRMVAGDTSALEKIKEQKEQLVEEGKDTKAAEQPEKKEKEPAAHKKSTAEKKTASPVTYEEYEKLFLKVQLTGTRRQTYIHDSLYRILAEVLPVIAPDMSVPTFVNNVLLNHLEQYEDVINGIYNLKANKKPVQCVQWKK